MRGTRRLHLNMSIPRHDTDRGFNDHVADAVVLFEVEEEFPEFGTEGFGVQSLGVGVGEAEEGFGEVFVSLGFVVVYESVPEFHEANFSRCTIAEILERLQHKNPHIRKEMRFEGGKVGRGRRLVCWSWGLPLRV